jgi:imidazolonepropionase-like amidohydrolase
VTLHPALALLAVLSLWIASSAHAQDTVELTVSNARLLTAPHQPVIDNGFVAVRDGVISAVGSGAPPAATKNIDAQGALLVAGFWNSHVHFTEPHWQSAARGDPEQLEKWLQRMLGRYGFTTVVDTGSDPSNTQALAYHVERKRVLGPRILMTGGSFVAANGSPSYLEVSLPELLTAADAVQKLQWVLNGDIVAVKIFTGSYISPQVTVDMPLDIVQVVANGAHEEDVLVIAHPQSLTGVQNAVRGGVDILAHTAPNGGPWSPALVQEMVERRVGLIPTLQLWEYVLKEAGVPPSIIRQLQEIGIRQLADFKRAGGDVLFGTDVGFMTDYDPREEYRLLAEAGLDFDAVLAALTTNPAVRLGAKGETGTLAVGQRADLVVLRGDPRQNLQAFSDVRYTIVGGVLVYNSDAP